MEDKRSFENKMLGVWPKQNDISVLKSNLEDMPVASEALIEQLYVDFCKSRFKETWRPVTDSIAKEFRKWVIEDAG